MPTKGQKMNRTVQLFVSYHFSVQQETTTSQLSRKGKETQILHPEVSPS